MYILCTTFITFMFEQDATKQFKSLFQLKGNRFNSIQLKSLYIIINNKRLREINVYELNALLNSRTYEKS